MRKKAYSKPVTALLSEDVYSILESLCDKEQVSISDWVRRAIERKLIEEDPMSRNHPGQKKTDHNKMKG